MEYGITLIFTVEVYTCTSDTSSIDLKETVIAQQYVYNICSEITITFSTIIRNYNNAALIIFIIVTNFIIPYVVKCGILNMITTVKW